MGILILFLRFFSPQFFLLKLYSLLDKQMYIFLMETQISINFMFAIFKIYRRNYGNIGEIITPVG